jgi:hypothetical protein
MIHLLSNIMCCAPTTSQRLPLQPALLEEESSKNNVAKEGQSTKKSNTLLMLQNKKQ